jgi:hypothetical protein
LFVFAGDPAEFAYGPAVMAYETVTSLPYLILGIMAYVVYGKCDIRRAVHSIK